MVTGALLAVFWVLIALIGAMGALGFLMGLRA